MQEDKEIEEYVNSNYLENSQKEGWKAKLESFLDNRYFIPILIVLVAIIAFSLGRISGLQYKKVPVKVLNNSPESSKEEIEKNNPNIGKVKGVSTESSQTNSSEQVVASKSGTKYHYPWCAGAKQISEKNKITFNTIAEARAAGYLPATNCKGLK